MRSRIFVTKTHIIGFAVMADPAYRLHRDA
jgi:hypothetical protein